MNNYEVTNQLNIEIQKIKDNDYSSYQRFYEQTSVQLYGVIWESVQNQELADALLIELYNDIYSSIATELTDNSQFYEWASNKARTISFPYLTNQNNTTTKNHNYIAETAAVVSANAALEASASAAVTGAEMAVAEGTSAGIGAMAGGYASAGMGATSGGVVASTAVSTGVLSTATKVGLSLGAKIAIGIVSAAVAIGGGIAIYHHIDANNKAENTTEMIAEITTEEVIEEITEDTTEEITTEEVVDETTARYRAYYELVESYMEQYPMTVVYNEGVFEGLVCVQLLDFNNTGEEQLLLTYSHQSNSGILFYRVDIYDYIEGEATKVETFDVETGGYTYSSIGYRVGENQGNVWLGTRTNAMKFDEIFEYKDNDFRKLEEYKSIWENGSYHAYINGTEMDSYEFFLKYDAEVSSYNFVYFGYHKDFDTSIEFESSMMKTILLKHDTIERIMLLAGYEDFGEDVPVLYEVYEEESGGFRIETNVNNFNEKYVIVFLNSTYELSKDGKSIYISNWNNKDAVYFTYDNNFLYATAWVYNELGVDGEKMWVNLENYRDEDFDNPYLFEDEYYDMPHADYGVSQEEFNERTEELMNKE